MEIIDPTTYRGWDELLISTPGASFFHTSSWARVLKESYGYRPLYFTKLENAKISVLIPMMEINSRLTGKRGVSLPFTDYSELIIPEDKSFQEVMGYLIQYGREAEWKYLEIRDGKLFISEEPVSLSYYGHILDLTKGEKKAYCDFRDSTQRNIKKAAKEGVKTSIEKSLEAVYQFYHLNCMTRREHGLPPQPKFFFEKIYDHIISKGQGFVSLGFYQEKAIAGAIFFHFGEKCIYKYGASDKIYQRLRANNIVMWEAIKWYCQNGFKSFYFGRTELENEGLRQFKNGWGSEEYNLSYFRYDLTRMSFVSSNKTPERGTRNIYVNRLFQNLPIPVLNVIGSLLYRHMG